jgi:glycosyltransferase involved in cell wall biosynthesis
VGARGLKGRELGGALGFGAGLALAALFNFAYTALLGRELPAHSFATFGVLLAILLMLSGPLNALSGGTEMFAARRGWFPAGRQRLVLLIVGGSLPVITMAGSDTVRAAGWFGFATVLWLLLAWNRGALTGLGRFGLVGFTFAAEGLARLGIGVGLVAAGWQTSGAGAGVALGMLLALGLTELEAPRSAPASRERLGTDIWLAVGGLLAVQMTQVVDVLAVRVLSHHGAGQYVAASSLARAVMFVQLPAAAYALRRSAIEGIDAAWRRVAILALAPALLLLLAIEAAPSALLRLTYGSHFAGAADLLQLLAMAMFLGGLVLVLAYLQMGEGRTSWAWPGAVVGVGAIPLIALSAHDPSMVAAVAIAMQALAVLAVGLPLWRSMAVPRPGLGILFLNWRDLRHPQGGGSEAYVEHVARRLAAAGNTVTIFCASHEHGPEEEIRDGVRYIRRGGWRSVYVWAALYHLLGRLGGHDVVVDVQNGIPFCSPLYCERPVIALVHHIHRGQWPLVFPPRWARFGWWVESRLSPRLYRGSAYVAVSEATRNDLAALGVDPGAIHVVRNGGMPGGTERAARAARPTLLSLGRLMPHKRVEILIRATATLRRQVPGLRLLVAGRGPWEQKLREEAARLGVTDAVEFLGWVDEEEKARLLAEAWVVGVPSLWEGWGLAVTEAAAQWTPSVAFRAGGLEESVRDGVTGLLADDEAGFLEALRRILTDSDLRERLGTAAAVWANSFSWDTTTADFADMVQNVAQRGRRAVPATVPELTAVDPA